MAGNWYDAPFDSNAPIDENTIPFYTQYTLQNNGGNTLERAYDADGLDQRQTASPQLTIEC